MAKVFYIKIFSFAKFQAVLFAIIGFALGFIYSVGGLIIDILVSLGLLSEITYETPGLSWGTALAFGALILMPIISFAIGFVLGVIEAFLFNLLSNFIGGIQKEF